MGNFIRKYISPGLLIVNLLVFMLFTLVAPHVKMTHSFLNILFFLLASAPLITLFVIRVIKLKNEKVDSSFYYDRAFNILALINIYFFFVSLKSIFALVDTIRAPLAIIFVIVFILGYLINIFELLLANKLLDRFIPIRDYSAIHGPDETKNLAIEAHIERIEARTSSFKFFVGLTALLAIIFFIVPLITEMFTIPLGGDFTQQQIPFYTNGYDDWWRFIKTGQFPLWDSNTFLGANNVGSNSFYYALNPFFLPILIFPRDLIPQGISILMIAKFTLAAMTMRWYLKYMGVNEKESRIFAIIYAFSGWNTYYLWFNHFMEVAVTFPLIFLGIEKVLKEKKITLLILSLGLMGFANYFFLMTVLVIGVLYAGFRYFQKLPHIEPSVIGLGILAFALGILVSSVVLFPSLVIALNSDRVTNATYLDQLKAAFEVANYKEVWKIITKWEFQSSAYTHKKYYPLISYFFPVLSDRSVALLNTSSYDNTISSLFSFSPVILLFFPAIYVSIKKKRFSHLLPIGFFLFALFTPFFYNAFHGFSKEYGRWQLIVTFSLITYVAMSLPEIKEEKPFVFDLSLLLNLILMLITVEIAFSFENKNGFSYMYEREYIVFYQFVVLFVTYLMFRFMRKSQYEYYTRSLLIFVEIAVMGTVTMFGHGFISYKNDVSGGLKNYNDDLVAIREIQALDKTYYRIYNTRANRGNDNLPMRENYNGLSAFHSLYNFELMDFNEWSRINYNYLGWSLGIFERRGIINDFLQIKYYVLNENDHAIRWSDGTRSYAPYKNIPNTYIEQPELSTPNRFVYKMENSFDIGFGVDDVISYERLSPGGDLENLILASGANGPIPLQNEELYLQSALLSYEDTQSVLRTNPTFGSKTYHSFPKNSYERLVRNLGLTASTYEFTNQRYPYEAQIKGGTLLPTPDWVNANGTLLTGASLPRQLDGAKHVIEYTRTDGTNIINGPGEIILNLPLAYYNSANLYYNYRYNVFLYDEDYKLITFDNHVSLPSAWRNWKQLRSFHTPKAVKKIALVPIGSAITPPDRNELFIYPQTTIDNIREKSLVNSLTDVKSSTNKVTFKTNYASPKFVVTTIPYDKGWEVKTMTKESLPVYKVQGGFVGFVSKGGEMTYTLKFSPMHFNLGLTLSVSALLLTGLLELNVYFFKKYKKSKKVINEDNIIDA